MALTQVTEIKPGQTIMFSNTPMTVSATGKPNGAETVLTFTDGGSLVMSDYNWFEVL